MKKIFSIITILLALSTAVFANVSAADKYDGFPMEKSDKLEGRVVILDAGHGDETTNSVGSYKEAEFALSEVMLVKENLENLGAKVLLTRSTSKDVFFYERTAQVNIWAMDMILEKYRNMASSGDSGANAGISELETLKVHMQSVIDDNSKASEYFNTPYSMTKPISSVLKRIFEYENIPEIYEKVIFISIHSNASDSSTSANGTLVYYMSNSFEDSKNYYTNYSNEGRNIKLATLLGNEVSAAGGFKNRGIETNDFYMIREHNIPSALIETAFHTNDSDRAKLADMNYRKRIANGITYAIVDYFDYYKSSETITPEPKETPEPTPVPKYYKADLNDDGSINAVDALMILKHAAKLELLNDTKVVIADTNRDGSVNSIDALLTLMYSAKKIESEEVEPIEPVQTQEVELTPEPEQTGEPEMTTEPEQTGEPEMTTKPEQTEEPEMTTEPEQTPESVDTE